MSSGNLRPKKAGDFCRNSKSASVSQAGFASMKVTMQWFIGPDLKPFFFTPCMMIDGIRNSSAMHSLGKCVWMSFCAKRSSIQATTSRRAPNQVEP